MASCELQPLEVLLSTLRRDGEFITNFDTHTIFKEQALQESEQLTVSLRLMRLLRNPLSYTFTRMLLREEPDKIVWLCQTYGLVMLSEPICRSLWTVGDARMIYMPALDSTVCTLLQARADPEGCQSRSEDFGRSPLIYSALAGWHAVCATLLDACAMLEHQDDAGWTALYYAVVHHEVATAQLLISRGASIERTDRRGRSIKEVSKLHGLIFPLNAVIENDSCMTKGTNSEDLASKVRKVSVLYEIVCNAQDEKSKGPNLEAQHEPAKRQKVMPDAEFGARRAVVTLPLSRVRFVQDFIALKRPTVLHSAASYLLNSQRPWTRQMLISNAGDCPVVADAIPYGDDFGMRHCQIKTTLQRFLDVESKQHATSGVPYYVFEEVDEKVQPTLARMIRNELGGLPEPLPHPFSNFQYTSLQFSVGSSGSGSPVHFHHDALNILLSGRKRWWLWPPANAAMSRVHPSLFRAEGCLQKLGPALELIQEPGDIVYVPDGWGHAVLNVEDDTISVACEFSRSVSSAKSGV
eukprot:gnl/MRDRNA2_/MRDRNA2_253940_c0_seq1.p1 gnl/MRDRNA2_/MRDRNA2_253940_c0~~gnl/MRDRNA2_/MRDRNA2_253940_c0_seq1.p1  ORF type:complete len:523 (+),score=65.75 gnl/MRDRNA2_/MRDRNA2_253940_c0_seq1:112-1680(+)